MTRRMHNHGMDRQDSERRAGIPGPKPDDRWRQAARNAAIRAQFDGANCAELATRWKMSERLIRDIVEH